MNLLNLIKEFLNINEKVNTKILPSQGLFYKDDFEIWIKKADIGDIIEYEHNYIKDDVGVVIDKLKKLVEKNITLSSGYKFDDIKSIDIIFIFFEIVRFTKGKSIKLYYFDDETGIDDVIEFNSDHFNYFVINDEMMNNYDSENKYFNVDGYKYNLPSIGLENSLTRFLLSKSNRPGSGKYNDYNYNFTFFLGDKRSLSFPEIDNLIQIFNYDMDAKEIKKVKSIVKMFRHIQNYSLKKDGKIININSKIDLEKIWK